MFVLNSLFSFLQRPDSTAAESVEKNLSSDTIAKKGSKMVYV